MAGDDMWPACNVMELALRERVSSGLLRPIIDEEMLEWLVPPVNDREPNLLPGYVVCFLAFLDRGFGIQASRFMCALVHYYGVELHNFNPNSIMQVVIFATVCEGYLGIPPHWNLWLHLFKAEMSPRNEGGEKRPLRAGGCTLQLQQSRSNLYFRSLMPALNRGWRNGWFYFWNDHDLLSEYTGRMLTECLDKWGWGAPTVEHKRLYPLLAGLAKLRQEGVTTAMVAVAFHKRRVLPLAQRVLLMWEMTPEASLVGTQMLEETVTAAEIAL